MKQIQVSLEGAHIMVGMPTYQQIPVWTTKSLLSTQELIRTKSLKLGHSFVIGCSIVQKARDEVAQLFLESDCTHLFWIDSDMVWNAEDFLRLVIISSETKIACGAYPAKVDDGPVTFFVKTPNGVRTVNEDYGLYEIDGIGLGFFCMTREVVQALADQAPTIWDDVLDHPRPSIFRVDTTEAGYRGTAGRFRSEDMAFCQDIRDLGYKIYLDPKVELGHVGLKVYKGSIKDAIQVAY